jgi:ASC-1-like (ASCH) protein
MTLEEKKIKVGDKVTFDTDMVESFMADTKSTDKAVQDYRQLVLAGVDQIGTVKEVGFSIVTVSYPDGWELPLPVKYLVVLP